jgi:hypothetical protein
MHKLRAQFPIARHRVIYTGRGAIITACRVDNPDAVVDHALYWLAVASVEEAQYVTGVLNSDALQERSRDAMSKGLLGERNIHRTPFLTAWPQYDPTDATHATIVEYAAALEHIAESVDLDGVNTTTHRRRRIRAELNQSPAASSLNAIVESLLGDTIPEVD